VIHDFAVITGTAMKQQHSHIRLFVRSNNVSKPKTLILLTGFSRFDCAAASSYFTVMRKLTCKVEIASFCLAIALLNLFLFWQFGIHILQ